MIHLLNKGKVILRPLEPGDIELLYRWENNMEIWEVSNTRVPYSKYILSEYIKDSAKDIYETRQLRLIIQTRKQEPVGAVDLFDFDPYHQRAGAGILIHETENRSFGYAFDALDTLADYSLNTLGLKQLYANIAADNTPSIRLFEKAGFIKAGVKKSWLKVKNGWKDEFMYQKILC